MRVTKCVNGHFYDADSYSRCPHCNPSEERLVFNPAGAQPRNPVVPQPAGNQPWDRTMLLNDETELAFGYENEPDYYADAAYNMPQYNAPWDDEATESIFLPQNQGDDPGETVSMFYAGKPEAPVSDTVRELRGVSNASVQKSVSYFSRVSRERGEKGADRRQASAAGNGAPVVGWLVCIAGPHIGQSFNIYAGKNSIGRGNDNDIVIYNDPAVSLSKHAWITYEARHGTFILQAGDGRFPDLNGEQVIDGRLLAPYDRIEIGETVLMFVNLCGENFDWNYYYNNEE